MLIKASSSSYSVIYICFSLRFITSKLRVTISNEGNSLCALSREIKYIFVMLYFLLSCARWLSDVYSVLHCANHLMGNVSPKEQTSWSGHTSHDKLSGHKIHIPSSLSVKRLHPALVQDICNVLMCTFLKLILHNHVSQFPRTNQS